MAEKKSKLAVIKTKPTTASVEDFINTVSEQKRKDSFVLLDIFKGNCRRTYTLSSSIVGFGFKRYTSPASGREVDWFKIGFAPRKANLSLYLTVGLNNKMKCWRNWASTKQMVVVFILINLPILI
jgi:hypothetical protein